MLYGCQKSTGVPLKSSGRAQYHKYSIIHWREDWCNSIPAGHGMALPGAMPWFSRAWFSRAIGSQEHGSREQLVSDHLVWRVKTTVPGSTNWNTNSWKETIWPKSATIEIGAPVKQQKWINPRWTWQGELSFAKWWVKNRNWTSIRWHCFSTAVHNVDEPLIQWSAALTVE